MSRPVIFMGPTLPKKEAAAVIDAVYLPPAAQGDIFLAWQTYKPRFIGLIDGYFECVPSIWHKEILFVMSRGVHVAGASSMGALRAAELHQFGMTGIGQIFELYRVGTIEDDDEVAIVHGPESVGYPLISEAMVNIRRTFENAREKNLITDDEMLLLISVAKSLHYKQRTYPGILDAASAGGLDPHARTCLEGWLPSGRCDIKKEDAIALLKFIKEQQDSDQGPKQVRYKFQRTTMWNKLVESVSDNRGAA